MLTDTKLRNLKPKESLYKVPDRDGMYVAVTPAGAVSFRYNYSINGRQETLTIGRYGVGGLTLAEARERLHEAKRMIADGRSPAREKARDKARVKDAKSFGAWAEKWLRGYEMADSTRDMRRSVYERELKPKFAAKLLEEFTHEDLRLLTDTIVERGAPATAVHVREIVMQVYRWASERGKKVDNPADLVRPSAIAKFKPRERALSPEEIGIMYQYLDTVGTGPQFRAAAKLLLLTLVRKSELSDAKWSEINFTEGVWTIPKERMKRRNQYRDAPAQQGVIDLAGELVGHFFVVRFLLDDAQHHAQFVGASLDAQAKHKSALLQACERLALEIDVRGQGVLAAGLDAFQRATGCAELLLLAFDFLGGLDGDVAHGGDGFVCAHGLAVCVALDQVLPVLHELGGLGLGHALAAGMRLERGVGGGLAHDQLGAVVGVAWCRGRAQVQHGHGLHAVGLHKHAGPGFFVLAHVLGEVGHRFGGHRSTGAAAVVQVGLQVMDLEFLW